MNTKLMVELQGELFPITGEGGIFNEAYYDSFEVFPLTQELDSLYGRDWRLVEVEDSEDSE